MYKKGFVMDMVELDVLFKGLLGETFVQDKEPMYKSQFDKLFLKAILFGALQNAHDYIENSTVLARSLPI